MAKIDRSEDLPEWFNLEKYRGCESFMAVEWLYELGRRAKLMRAHPDYMESFDEQGGAFQEVWHSIWKSTAEANAEPLRQIPIAPHGAESAHPASMPVRPVLTFDLVMQAHRDEMARREGKCCPEKVSRWSAIGDPSFPIKEGVKIARAPIEIDSYIDHVPPRQVIQVDLSATDSVLMDAFAAWLKAARARQPGASKRERPAYRDWARYGLLPYLDLLIWAMETGNQIPHHVMAQAVGYPKGGDSFRKTVPRLADDLMRNLDELEALAAIEAASEKLGT